MRDRVDLLYAALPLSQVLTIVTACALFWIHRDDAGGLGRWWLVCAFVIFGLRGLSGWLRRASPELNGDDRHWLRAYRFGTSMAGLCWGIGGLLFYPPGADALPLFTLLILAGVSAGALSSMAADHVAYRLFVFLTLSPICLAAFARGNEVQLYAGLLIVLLTFFLLKSSHSHTKSIIDSLTLRYENSGLIHDLETEKKRLINEAETMMGTVLSCAPIALWAIDNQGVISFMDGRHLYRKSGLDLPQVGDNLLDAFADHAQILFETNRALRGESLVTEIELKGHAYEVHYSPLISDDDGQQGAIGVAIDISERKRQEKELSHRAHYDQLTGLPNRSLIMNQIDHAFEHARRQNRYVALLFLDLDNFKTINDTLGHKAGDDLLCQAADRLKASLRESDLPARLGGDEFLVVSENLKGPEDAEIVAHKTLGAFQRPFALDNREVFVTTSVGIAIFPQDGLTAAQVLQSADTAMYHAKSLGKNSYRYFTNDMQKIAERHLEIETELRRALERHEMYLLYQPKIDIANGRVQGAEALLRWRSGSLGQIAPDKFIPVAEFAGLMPAIGEWVMRTACIEAARWQTLYEEPVHVAINVSPQQFRNTGLLNSVKRALAESGLAAQHLELEITENLLVQDAPETMLIFEQLRELGISLALDDFGTGYSSLSYLKKFPIQVLKIDRAFVEDLGKDREDDSLIDAIIAMAHSMRMSVVAEGVETKEQLAYLTERGVHLMQGYHFGPAIEADSFRLMLEQEPQPTSAFASLATGTHR